MRPEAALQAACLRHVREGRPDLLAVNVHGGGWSNKGLPDLLVTGQGKVVFVELKAGTGYAVQPDQELWAARLRRVGTRCETVRSLDAFRALLEEVFG